MKGESAWIGGIGMTTACGTCTAQTAAAVRAGISVYKESNFYSKNFAAMKLALLADDILPPLDESLLGSEKLSSRQARMLQLANMALIEALQALPADHHQALPLFLAGPENMPRHKPVTTGAFLNQLTIQSGFKFDTDSSLLYAAGRAGGMQALQDALALLSTGSHNFVLLGGVDTYWDLGLLSALDKQGRVLADGITDGFAPGEGAAFLLLCSDQVCKGLKEKPTVKIHSPGLADEQGHRDSSQVYTGDGLASAVALAIQELNNVPVRTVFSSMNGESLHAKEWGVAYVRNSSAFDSGNRFEHPAECFGDTGAAAMPVLTGLAAIGMIKGYFGTPALVFCSSDGRHRGAVCMSIEL